jgi:hypothetical protein
VSYLPAPETPKPPGVPCACLNEARCRFERFHRFAPHAILRARCSRLIPPVLVHVGELRALVYRSDRGQCGKPRNFIHFLHTPAVLASDPAGRQLYVVGGRYRVTNRGIEG